MTHQKRLRPLPLIGQGIDLLILPVALLVLLLPLTPELQIVVLVLLLLSSILSITPRRYWWIVFFIFAPTLGLGIWSAPTLSTLSAQLLGLGLYLIVRLTNFALMTRLGDLSPEIEGESCCGTRRLRALLAEHRRFRRIIFRYFCIVSGIGWSLVALPESSPLLEVLLSWFIPLFMLPMYTLEGTHLRWMERRLRAERWLTILDDHNRPIGRIAQTQFASAQGRLSVVRLVAVSHGMVYLERTAGLCSGEERYDTPLVDWVCEDYRPQEIAQRLIDERFCGVRRARPHLSLQYHAEEGGMRLVVYLYTVQISEPDLLLIDCRPIRGKWWSFNLLFSELGKSDFSPLLSCDIPYLEQTMLLAERLKQEASPLSCS